jgi:hypothetical protein
VSTQVGRIVTRDGTRTDVFFSFGIQTLEARPVCDYSSLAPVHEVMAVDGVACSE